MALTVISTPPQSNRPKSTEIKESHQIQSKGKQPFHYRKE